MQAFVSVMVPAPGERLCRFVGDRVRFELRDGQGHASAQGWRAFLRTNLGRAAELRREILEAHTRALAPAGGSWRDIPMVRQDWGWSLELPLAEVGYFKAKAYAVGPRGWQHWPDGPDVGISVHPDKYRTGNTIYCAFTRLFGQPTHQATAAEEPPEAPASSELELSEAGYAVIPPSGKLRDLARQMPHIVERLGCRILHLLPVNPTPTTYARFGRFGSPYATLDLAGIDPALVVFDKQTTGIDQFRELTYAAHLHGSAVFLDIVINHTGWGSVLQERHHEWFLRQPDQSFASPGAWGVTWEDLVELKHENVGLWDELSEIFLTWCRRGVDGFRCDAGYKVPVPAWQYIVARVQQEYPETIFLLEGLGGSWEATEALLTEGGLQWAYSELFQNYTGAAVAGYLEHCLQQNPRVGLLVHYSETHDNDRLAARGRAWSLLRNRLCALTSVAGGFGFTCGVEWLADQKIQVHNRTSLKWGNADNIVAELARLNRLLIEHPCFFDGARLTRISPVDSTAYALLRVSVEGSDQALVLVNTSLDEPAVLRLGPIVAPQTGAEQLAPGAASTSNSQGTPGKVPVAGSVAPIPGSPGFSRWVDLLGQTPPRRDLRPDGTVAVTLPPGAVYCLSPVEAPRGLHGEPYRQLRAQAAWGLKAISAIRPAESVPRLDWRELAGVVHRAPGRFLAALSDLSPSAEFPATFLADLRQPGSGSSFPQVVTWTLLDLRRTTPVPPGHWLLLQDNVPFRARLEIQHLRCVENVESIPAAEGHIAFFRPQEVSGDADLLLERYGPGEPHVRAGIRFLQAVPEPAPVCQLMADLNPSDLVLLTNGRGGMARLCADLSRVNSKYDCVLAANLHPTLPVDRHVLAKRIRVWVDADGFLSPLNFRNLRWLSPGPPAVWHFVANAGDGRSVEIQVSAQMLAERNATVFCFHRPTSAQARGKQLPESAHVRLTVRLDIEDRGFHSETHRNGGAEHHFNTHTRSMPANQALLAAAFPQLDQSIPLAERFAGFAFTPAPDRSLRVFADFALYHPQPEWSENIPHPVEQSRGQVGSGDAFSPGWFEVPLGKGAAATLVLTADASDPDAETLDGARTSFSIGCPTRDIPQLPENAGEADAVAAAEAAIPPTLSPGDHFYQRLLAAVRAFVVNRGAGKTVVAGYPWFLDWGRDTFICARGLLAAGMKAEVEQLVLTFARFERGGTLPNTIFGEDASNRDTSDAPLWFGIVCEELGADLDALYPVPGRSIRQVLESIASNYAQGTPNGIRMDPASALIWSPSHFTWMDTNYPAGTPREGFPVEIQALWIRLLRLLARVAPARDRDKWQGLAELGHASLEKLFWREDKGWYADVLPARRGQSAQSALPDDALRSNGLFVVSLGLASEERARRCVEAALKYLVVPGALRSLAPLPVSVPLPIHGVDGRLLNDPKTPYWGQYEGDEDTRRKPAYHNGTAWTWTFPVFCEALVRAWNFTPASVSAARAYLGSIGSLMSIGCLGQIPEILDGDAPHTQRGCDAQAWGATEALRVWKLLQ